MSAEYKPCVDCGSPARVSPFSSKDEDFAYHDNPRDCTRALSERLVELTKRLETIERKAE